MSIKQRSSMTYSIPHDQDYSRLNPTPIACQGLSRPPAVRHSMGGKVAFCAASLSWPHIPIRRRLLIPYRVDEACARKGMGKEGP
jgi:hypothetical protein